MVPELDGAPAVRALPTFAVCAFSWASLGDARTNADRGALFAYFASCRCVSRLPRGSGDLKAPFAANANLALRDLGCPGKRSGASVVVYLLCYVLNEVMGPTGDPSCLRIIDRLWERAVASESGCTAIFLFREPNQRAVRILLDHRPQWREGTDYWLLPAGGLVAVARRHRQTGTGRSR